MEGHGLDQRKALVRFYFGTSPKSLTQLAKDWGELEFALQFSGKLTIKEIIRK